MLKESGLTRKGGFPVHTAKKSPLGDKNKKSPTISTYCRTFFCICPINKPKRDHMSSMFKDSIKATELAKIKCGKEPFSAIDNGIGFELANRFATLEGKIMANE